MDPGYLKQREEESKPLQTVERYKSLIEALLYAAVMTRPDISIATSILGRRVTKPTESDWNEAKRILRYLNGTINYELCLGFNHRNLECFVDADWAGDTSDRKSNSGYLFNLGGGLIGWGYRKQKCVALSSTEAEYITLAECSQELQWTRKLLNDIGEPVKLPITINEDNQSTIALTQGDRTERRSKHIDTKYNYIKELVREGVIQLKYCPSEFMEADILTKPLQMIKLQRLREAIGLKPYSVEEEC
ncbi:uncharacterized protein LOC129766214 [Toxorhynchites rutilus septentrionalis]|uniref:uncharacterized protein LOC129766214 n=1 Tax=Toxorhynchites rutilus septentrionalis TaxID=329112 RepID=UPI00247B2A7E|nr:uncharacterized protein LOC129766214 [Toxorhynchites rutilus septentrionalis]